MCRVGKGKVKQGSGWAGEELPADLHIVDAFGLCVHHEEAVIEVLFGPPPVGQGEGLQKQRRLHLQGTATEKPLRQAGPTPPTRQGPPRGLLVTLSIGT